MLPDITESTRFCTEHLTTRLIIFNGIVCCERCDPVDEWRTHRPIVALVEPEPMPRWRKVLVFWGLVVACWVVPIGVAGLIIRWVLS